MKRMITESRFKSYNELLELESFLDRYHYLRLKSQVGSPTFGFDRYLNQLLYRSRRWRSLRNEIIIRDNGCDLGVDGFQINDQIIVHHMNPITAKDIGNESGKVFDPNNLICVSNYTHLAIHYGDESLLPELPIDRYPGDTTPWKRK